MRGTHRTLLLAMLLSVLAAEEAGDPQQQQPEAWVSEHLGNKHTAPAPRIAPIAGPDDLRRVMEDKQVWLVLVARGEAPWELRRLFETLSTRSLVVGAHVLEGEDGRLRYGHADVESLGEWYDDGSGSAPIEPSTLLASEASHALVLFTTAGAPPETLPLLLTDAMGVWDAQRYLQRRMAEFALFEGRKWLKLGLKGGQKPDGPDVNDDEWPPERLIRGPDITSGWTAETLSSAPRGSYKPRDRILERGDTEWRDYHLEL